MDTEEERVVFQGPLRLIYLADNIANARESYVSDISASYDACLAAARKGNGDAAGAIGHMYLNRSIKCNNYQEAAHRWSRSAIELGSAYGHWLEGWILFEAGNADEGVAQLREAMDQYFPPAAYDFGVIYERGWGVPRDRSRSKKYYQLAEKLGHLNAPWSIQNINVSGEFGLLKAMISRLVRPLSMLRWQFRVFFGPKLTPLTLTYTFPERMRAFDNAATTISREW